MMGDLEKVLKDIVERISILSKKIRKLETVPPGANKFTELSDAPVSYVGSGGLVVAVNGGETALEFIAGGGGGVHEILSATHSDSDPDSVVQGDLIVGNGTPEWSRLPVGGAGDVLTSDGTDPSWQPGGGGGPHDILSATHSDTSPDSVVQGDIIIGDGTPEWVRLPVGDAGDVLTSDGTDVSWEPGGAGGPHDILSATHSDSAVDAVTEGSLIMGNATPKWDELVISVPVVNVRNVLGVDTAETQPSWKALLDGTNPTTIAPSAAAAPGTSLIASHRDHTHGAPATFPATAHNVLSASHGDTLPGAIAQGDVLIGNATPKIDVLTIGGNGTVLTSNGADPSWQLPGSLALGPYKVYYCKSFI